MAHKRHTNNSTNVFILAIPGLFFLYFRLFNTVDRKQMFDESLAMTGFKPRISGVGGDRSTTEPQPLPKNV